MPVAESPQSTSTAKSLRRPFFIAVIASLCAAAVLGITVILTGNFDDLSWRILSTTILIGVASIIALATVGKLDSTWRLLAITTLTLVTISFVTFLFIIWLPYTGNNMESFSRVAIISGIMAVSLCHVTLLAGHNQAEWLRLLQLVTSTLIVTVGAMLSYLVWGDSFNQDLGPWYFKLLAVFGILDVLGTILVPVLRRLTRHAEAPAA